MTRKPMALTREALAEPRELRETWRQRFAAQMEPYRPALLSYCRGLVSSAWEADDLAQDTWLKAYRMFVRASGENRLSKAYLYRIASNTWIDRCRQRRPEAEPLAWQELPSPGPDVDQADLVGAMEALVAALPPRQRVIVLLVDAFGYTAAEAARLIGATEGAVKAGLHRARTTLAARRDSASPDGAEAAEATDRARAREGGVSAGGERKRAEQSRRGKAHAAELSVDSEGAAGEPDRARAREGGASERRERKRAGRSKRGKTQAADLSADSEGAAEAPGRSREGGASERRERKNAGQPMRGKAQADLSADSEGAAGEPDRAGAREGGPPAAENGDDASRRPRGRREVDEGVVYAYLRAFTRHDAAALVRLLNEETADCLPAVIGKASGPARGRDAQGRQRGDGALLTLAPRAQAARLAAA